MHAGTFIFLLIKCVSFNKTACTGCGGLLPHLIFNTCRVTGFLFPQWGPWHRPPGTAHLAPPHQHKETLNTHPLMEPLLFNHIDLTRCYFSLHLHNLSPPPPLLPPLMPPPSLIPLPTFFLAPPCAQSIHPPLLSSLSLSRGGNRHGECLCINM